MRGKNVKVSSIYLGSSIRRPINTFAAGGLSSSTRKREDEEGVWIHDIEVIRSSLGVKQLRQANKDEQSMQKKARAIEMSRLRIKRIKNDNKAAIQREVAKMRNMQFLLRYVKNQGEEKERGGNCGG